MSAAFSAGELAEWDAAALRQAAEVVARPNTTAARPVWRVNHVLGYGQSLSSGWEGWPALSVAPRHDSLMLGDSVRPQHEAGPHWLPVGEPALRPLRATHQTRLPGPHTPCAPLSDAEVARLPPGNVALGETVLEGAVNTFRALQLRAAAMSSDPEHRLLASSCGVSGRSVAQLSAGAAPELFNRLRDSAAAGRAAAAPASHGVLALLWLQGEQDYVLGTSRDDYKAALRRLYADTLLQVANWQDYPPALFSYQTGGPYARDAGRLAVGMAQLDAALTFPDWFLVGPAYPVTNKPGGHLDANGHRWLGCQFGKAMHRVLTLGETWRPLHPTEAVRRGDSILLRFHVPVPPLAFDQPWHLTSRIAPADHGFRVTDAAGAVPLAGVALAGAALVRLTLARPPQGEVLCWYASEATRGYGGLRDSDATVAEEVYEYAPDTGHYPSANVAELVGRPYPLWNWCVGFVLPVGT